MDQTSNTSQNSANTIENSGIVNDNDVATGQWSKVNQSALIIGGSLAAAGISTAALIFFTKRKNIMNLSDKQGDEEDMSVSRAQLYSSTDNLMSSKSNLKNSKFAASEDYLDSF